jgi:two-component sensor histidine kinase
VAQDVKEVARLEALFSYDMLDTPRESDFDEIAELASKICETPIAVVNLIADGRQFFKAEVGLGVRETPLDSSFCAKAILEEDFLVVQDATKDPRFDCNPLVTGEPGLRFYAGALLKTADGYPIGTVCVLDFKARPLSPLQETTLRVLARQVMRQLELRRVLRERDEAQAQQTILNKEIVHRMKNTLAMVQAIASQTLKGVTEQDAVEALARRIAALGTAHDQLMQENWTAAPLRRIVRLLLNLHDTEGRIESDGPDIELGPRATLSISLLLHELATNAAKYGALSAPNGRVLLSWRVEDGGDPTMIMNWEERDGPVISEPEVKSFGTRLIRLGLVGKGGVEKSYPPTGFVAEFRATLEDIHAV